jgi:hypothetical protein
VEVEEVSDFVLDSAAGAGLVAGSDAEGLESAAGSAFAESPFDALLEGLLE